MDHAYITGAGLILIQVDSFSGWPEVFRLPVKKSSTINRFDDSYFRETVYQSKNPAIRQCIRIL